MNATQAYEYGTPKSVPSKIFGFSMALWALILTATYTANLASLLVDRQDTLLDVETVEEAAVFGYPLCTFAGTNSDSYIEQVYPTAVRKPKSTIEGMYQGLNDGECAFAVEVTQSWLGYENKREFNPRCNLKWIGDGRTIIPNSAGFATKADAGFKCTGLVRDVINFHMEELISEGFLEDAWGYENRRYQDVDCDTFRSELLDELIAEDDGDNTESGERRRKAEVQNSGQTRRRVMDTAGIEKMNTSPHLGSVSGRQRRKLKSSTKAASSAGAVGGDSEQMELDAMIGSFFIHWMLMVISIMIAIANRYFKNKRRQAGRKNMNPETSVEYGMEKKNNEVEGDVVAAKGDQHPSTTDLRRQMDDMKHSFETSQAIMMKGQKELQSQVEALLGLLQDKERVISA